MRSRPHPPQPTSSILSTLPAVATSEPEDGKKHEALFRPNVGLVDSGPRGTTEMTRRLDTVFNRTLTATQFGRGVSEPSVPNARPGSSDGLSDRQSSGSTTTTHIWGSEATGTGNLPEQGQPILFIPCPVVPFPCIVVPLVIPSSLHPPPHFARSLPARPQGGNTASSATATNPTSSLVPTVLDLNHVVPLPGPRKKSSAFLSPCAIRTYNVH